MKGYIYISGTGSDPIVNNNLNDPIFGKPPTLGACMPNIRRFVDVGDFIFVVSGKTEGVQQYVVGGFQVDEKIHALDAYDRFPENHLYVDKNGILQGNIIVTRNGAQHHLDRHSSSTFESRLENYIVGRNPIALTTRREAELGRQQTIGKLADVLGRRRGNRVIDVMARWSKLNENQVTQLIDWLQGIKYN
ncbi:hypothetical protein [Ferruginivarius sediminum]|uniref:Nmad2 family putative nucleotide modification protein n=1 Tax=Ferruginivarius sediminum TaxID=2661937 RepID=UPI0011C081B3|nr:hypothetical protein [Ferruginivarius sediminum]